MKAIIVAAGKGSRITGNIGQRPKCTLPINGESLIRRNVKLLQKYKIDVIVCTGFMKKTIEEELEDLDVSYRYNPFYSVMNNMGTLWWAKDIFGLDDVLVLSADLIFEETILKKILSLDKPLVMLTDKSRVQNGDYFFKLDSEGKVEKYGADLTEQDKDCEYVGICKVDKKIGCDFKRQLEDMVNQELYGNYLEYVFFSFITKCGVDTLDVSGLMWKEIDYYEDYQQVIKEFGE